MKFLSLSLSLWGKGMFVLTSFKPQINKYILPRWSIAIFQKGDFSPIIQTPGAQGKDDHLNHIKPVVMIFMIKTSQVD